MTPGPTVDITQAAALMKVHTKTVLDKINSGELAAGKVGRAYVFMTKDVLALIEHEIISQTAARMRRPGQDMRTPSKSHKQTDPPWKSPSTKSPTPSMGKSTLAQPSTRNTGGGTTACC